MTLTEIHQRLKEEFPGRYVTLNITVSNGQDEPCGIVMYDSEAGGFSCSNLEDGITQLKLKLGMVQPEMSIGHLNLACFLFRVVVRIYL